MVPQKPESRRTFMKRGAVFGLALLGTKSAKAYVPQKFRIQNKIETMVKEQKVQTRKRLEPVLIENIRARMLSILKTNKTDEKLNQLLNAKNSQSAKNNYKEDLFEKLEKASLQNALEHIAELETAVAITRVFLTERELIETMGLSPEFIKKLEETSQFLIQLRDPAYEILYRKIEEQQRMNQLDILMRKE
ncbi:MAG: hypothetical protein CL944_01815 [Candidatus Diapherotrites archaeon]|uniref:Uncharacterized protein n=1 Tax=Candidatus Iainarchaeum sp. TaxID=3101447 RepID=A0A2D6LPS1_9ARCH|nr:hypothetical protein [Candidatus Diapherotrites archaeon]|tara:strand:- start:7299 stop:7871 length:573 start_codon:yes stop_codon:yes gene_type:complete